MKKILALSVLVLSFAASAQYNPYPPTNSCRAELTDQYGYVVQTFLGSSYSYGCEDARYQCEEALRRNQRRGQLRYGRCVVRNGNGYGTVTRSCSANMFVRGRFVQEVRAQATGSVRSNVQQMACKKALSKCQSMASRYGYRGATCSLGNGRGGYQPPRRRPTPPRRGPNPRPRPPRRGGVVIR